MNKPTLKDDTISHSFTLFICGGPCHPSSNSVPWDLIFLGEQLVYSVMAKINSSNFVL